MTSSLSARIGAEFDKSLGALQHTVQDIALRAQVADAVGVAMAALHAGRKLLFASNGGSAADAQHWAGELASRFYFDRPGLSAIALTADTSILTAIGNDYGYDYVFARQIEALAHAGDVFFAISTSGNSKNILRTIEAACARGVKTISFTGQSGGAMAEQCDLCFKVPVSETPHIQKGHEFLGHLLCGLIEHKMFGQGS